MGALRCDPGDPSPAMPARTGMPFVDTNIIPDRNAGIGSLLRDLQRPDDPGHDGPPLLDAEFAFIDVGVSRARVAIALRTLLTSGLGMHVDYVATERPEAVPYAHVTLLGERAEKIRRGLSAMISSKDRMREVMDWHYVIDRQGQVASVAYSYHLHGNEVWEAYFMGRRFMYAGDPVEFSAPQLDEMLAPDLPQIEATIGRERSRGRVSNQPGPRWDGYRIERNPLQADLAASGITLQATDVPQRVQDRQNVLFLGNVLTHYPRGQQGRELERVTSALEAGDLVIVQTDEIETASIDVLRVGRHGGQKTRERVRWIDTKALEVHRPLRSQGSWLQILVRPEVERWAGRIIDCLAKKTDAPEWRRQSHRALVHRHIGHVFGTFFRALPVEETLRLAIREAVRRLPPEEGPKGVPVFEGDAHDAYGGALGVDPNPLVSDAEFIDLRLTDPGRRRCDKASGPSPTRGRSGERWAH